MAHTKSIPLWYPITLEEAKAQARVDGTAEDELVLGMIAAATAWAEDYTGMLFSAYTVDEVWDCWPVGDRYLEFGAFPLREVTWVNYYDYNAVQQTLSALSYSADKVARNGVVLNYGLNWPELETGRVNAISARYLAGPESEAHIDPRVKQAIKLYVTEMYESRENEEVGKGRVPNITAAENLLNFLRRYA